MTGIRLEIRGYNRVRNALRATIAAHPKDVDDMMYKWAQETRAHLKSKPYPPVPANSRYKRTGRLASGWAASRVKPGQVAITNNAKSPKGRFYARYVVGKGLGDKGFDQTAVHKRNGWWLARDVVQKERIPILTKRLGEMYEDLWAKNG